jgi:hypothetical protein
VIKRLITEAKVATLVIVVNHFELGLSQLGKDITVEQFRF